MLDIKNYKKIIKKMNVEKQKNLTELNIAKQIQSSMLPSIFPNFTIFKEIEIYAVMMPARQVGGDFYDFFLIDKNRLAFVIADVSGKGIYAAFFMIIAKTLIKNQVHADHEPSTILEKVNNQLCKNNNLSMFLTAFLGILDLKTGEIIFSNAGHTRPAMKKFGKKFKILKLKQNFVIAGINNLKFQSEKIFLKTGDIIFFYTDGLTEINNSKNKLWGKKRFLTALNSIDTNKNSIKGLVESAKNKAFAFAGEKSQSDDMTILAIRFNGNSSDEF
jgi:sigma-B regulation protein RsbU (phosphoserine phosphatase)